MNKYFSYLYIPLLSSLLICAQALWASFIKNENPFSGSITQIAVNLISSPKVWLGGTLYIAATAVYFILLSRFRFFSIQLAMTALAIFFSTLLSYFIFHEKITTLNFIGMLAILTGITLVFTT
jgi:drug/metabolite transporter (DMT)-like permease